MNPLVQFKKATSLFIAVLLLNSFGLVPLGRAVVPAPDGGYPGGNTAEGQNALFSLTTGGFNTAVGYLSLRVDSTNSFNTAVGAGALFANTADSNTATGAGALLSNTVGDFNTATGAFALSSNTTSGANTATGYEALRANTTGTENTATGIYALEHNTIGMLNTATGTYALPSNTSGNNNTANGGFALWDNTAGSNNTALGASALFNNSTGSNNIALGATAGGAVSTASNVICIGINGANVSDSFYVGNVFETSIDPDNLAIAIDFHGKLGTPASSRRFKDHIKPMDKASEVLLSLRPVTFHYKNDPKCSPRFGLIAEEVAEVDPDLVALDKESKPYSVRYDQVNAMLLNEFLKEHRKVENLKKDFQATVAQQEKEIGALTATVKEQAAQIQKVSAQLEASKPAPQVVNNP